LYDYLQVEQTKSTLPQFTFYFPNDLHPCPSGSQCVAFNPAFLTGLQNLQALTAASNAGSEVDMINNNLKAPYSDQFSLGIRNKLSDWNTDATVSRIVSKDGLVFTLGNRYPSGAFWVNGGQPWGNGVPGFGNLIIGNSGIETRSTSLLLSADKPYTHASHWGATLAYTYTKATQNRDVGEHYAFDGEWISQYPFIDSNQVPRHRFVATGSVDGPWGLIFSSKLTLESPIPHNDIACGLLPTGTFYPTGANCIAIAGTPSGSYSGSDPHAVTARTFGFGGKVFGYRDIDFQVTKNFDLTRGMSAYVRFDVLNAFNYKNYSDYFTSYGSNGVSNAHPAAYNGIGNIMGTPREFKITAGFRF
jgi:hypothetical protein